MSISIEDIDRRLYKKIEDAVVQKVFGTFQSTKISQGDFGRIVDNEFVQQQINKINEFYASMGEVDVSISVNDLYNVYNKRFV